VCTTTLQGSNFDSVGMDVVQQVRAALTLQTAPTTIGVLLVDDHVSFRQALALALPNEQFHVAAESGIGSELNGVLDRRPAADVAVVHVGEVAAIPGIVMRFRLVGWDIPLVILAPRRDASVLSTAIQYGAAGVVPTSAGVNDLIEAIRIAGAGGSLLTQAELREVLDVLDLSRGSDTTAAPPMLTVREHEILQLLVDGLSARDIDLRLRISPRTRRTHIAHILAKLGAHSQVQAVTTALREGLIHLPVSGQPDLAP
jgi:DNA-binding NarL/FixJ family response regulator